MDPTIVRFALDYLTMISVTAEYALRASVYLAKHQGRSVNRHEIAEAASVPTDYLLKVLGALDDAGIVRSKRGPGGGYWLTKPAAETTSLEVLEAVSTIPRIHRCPLGITDHEQLCPLHQLMDDAAYKMEQAFRKVTLAELAKSTRSVSTCAFPNLTE